MGRGRDAERVRVRGYSADDVNSGVAVLPAEQNSMVRPEA
jgi:hypothetical protein